MTITQKVTTGVLTALFLSTVMATGASAAVNVDVSGNGRKSTNTVNVNANKKTKVTQTNVSSTTNAVGINNNTGGNKANDNLGDVTLTSGDATATVAITNTGNTNSASIPCICQENGDVDVTVSDNLRRSTNTVNVYANSKTKVEQTNVSDVLNAVEIYNKTGHNTANDNGGDANVDLTSGNADATVSISNSGGENTLED